MQLGSFIKVFILPEFHALTSNKWKLLLLLIIVTTAFWGIGFSSAIQVYLKKKMDNPFVRFITVTITDKADYDALIEDLNKLSIQERFNFMTPPKIHVYIPNFQSTGNKQPDAYIRAINKEDPLYNFLINESDIVLSNSPIDITENETSWGVIVTEDYLKKLGYTDIYVSYINYIKPGSVDDTIPLPIAAVVKQLPDYLNGIVSENLLRSIKGGFDDNPLDDSLHTNELCFFIPTDKNNEELLVELQAIFPDIKPLPNECQVNGARFILYNTYNPEFDFERVQKALSKYDIIRTYNFSDKSLPPPLSDDKPEFLSIPFNSLDSVTVFQKYIEENHNHVRIDMNTIEAKNNFNFFDKISNLLSVLLTIFGSILMIAITLNTVLNHIDKNKTNLGTLKAFGMSNLSVTLVYTSISALLILIITITGYAIVYFIGNVISYGITSIYHLAVEQGTALFVLNLDTFLVLTFVVIPIVTVSLFIYLKLFNKTPGDLIYDRD